MAFHLGVIVWKNLLIRKKHWLLTIIEILLPTIFFLGLAYGRSKIDGLNKINVPDPSYHEYFDKNYIDTNLPVGEFHLWYSPYTEQTRQIMTKIQERFGIPGEAMRNFSSEKDMKKDLAKNNTIVIYALQFKGNDLKHLNYDISIYDRNTNWKTEKLFPPLFVTGQLENSRTIVHSTPVVTQSEHSSTVILTAAMYIYKGFAALQIAVNEAFMEISLGTDKLNVQFTLQEFPYPPYVLDNLSTLFMYFLPLLTIFSFIFLFPAVLQRVGEEKQTGIKEFLKMVGVKSWVLWMGWLIHALMTNIVSISIIVILMKVPFWGVPYPPIEKTDGLVLFVFLLLYCIASITFCFLLATIIPKPSVATVVGMLIWIFSYFIPVSLLNNVDGIVSWKYKILLAIFPNTALSYGYSAISVYETRGVGSQWSNIFYPGSGDNDDVTIGQTFIILILNMVICMLLSFYIENIRPGQYGIKKSAYFPVTNLIKWVKMRLSPSPIAPLRTEKDSEIGLSREDSIIQIRRLYKKYHKTVAVDDLNLDMYDNNITVLLGHNGAGKSTTMAILTGMIDATRGEVIVNGKDIRKHTDEVRQDLGLCPQHNLLFTDLTVEEHLRFCAMLKGIKKKKSRIAEILRKFRLDEKKDSLAQTLSGGMKRKLCLAMALIGDSKVLVLDEPTSGMDPESRRHVWDLLLDARKTKSILISTHFMEEADVLGDFVAIMADGRLQCHGTPMELKKRYKTGYHLRLLLDEASNVERELTTTIQNFCPESSLFRQSENTLEYLLPIDEKKNYAKMFEELEKKQKQSEIQSIGLTFTTLTDVFLKAHDEIDGADLEQLKNRTPLEFKPLQSRPSDLKNLVSLFYKRFFIFRRKFLWYLPAIFVAITTVLLVMEVNMSNTDYYKYNDPSLDSALSIYGKTKVFYGGNNDSNENIAKMGQFYQDIVSNQQGLITKVEDTDVSQGIINAGIDNIAYYQRHMIAAAEFNNSKNNKIIVNALYSSFALHSIPISINLVMNAAIKTLLNDNYSITTRNTPLKFTYTDVSPAKLSPVGVGIAWLILIPLGITCLMSNFIVFPHLELSTKFLKIQTLAGVRSVSYWGVNVLCDFCLSIVKILIVFLCMAALDFANDFTILNAKEYAALVIIFVTYMLCGLPYTYLFSYRKTISGGFNVNLILLIFMGIAPTIVVTALTFSGDLYYMKIAENIKVVFGLLFPPFSLCYICYNFSQKYVENYNWRWMSSHARKIVCDNTPNPCCNGNTLECQNYQSYFKNEEHGVMYPIAVLFGTFLLYFVSLIVLNSKMYEKMMEQVYNLPHSLRRVVNSGHKRMTQVNGDDQTSLEVSHLKKWYGNKTIVDELQLTLKKNKCFGLLGVNGAGKSTTFNMLTKMTFPDYGNIKLMADGKAIEVTDAEYSSKIGYCPQEDCLNFYLTGRELLFSVALIRGFSLEKATKVTNELLNCFGLEKYADKQCLEYSGGNKRKLSSCIAFVGTPDCILLDEPSSGVDPASRRKFWSILSNLKTSTEEVSFLLCSHSMEECENLCDEIGIMKAGKMGARGTLLALKEEHQGGYKIDVRLSVDYTEVETLVIDIKNQIKITKQELFGSSLSFGVAATEQLSDLFQKMEKLKEKYKAVNDYAISDMSLEDIFLSVAKSEPEGTALNTLI